MKRVAALLVAVCVLLVGSVAFADLHDDLENMSIEELESVIQDATEILEKKRNEASSEESEDGIESMNEGSTVLSDENFIADLSKGLVARWDIAYAKTDKEISIMSEKQHREYSTQCVAAELAYISKYNEYEFTDSKLAGYAQMYLYGLQNQYVAITEYYGNSEIQYNEYHNDGYRSRAKGIYLINKVYGLDIPSKYSDVLIDFVSLGQVYEYIDSVEALLTREMANKELKFETDKNSVTIKPFNVNNESALSIPGLSMQIHFIKDDIEVLNRYIVSFKDLNPGKNISSEEVWVYDQHFDSFYYTFSYNLQMNGYYEQIEGKIMPVVQYSWDGKLKKAGELAEGQPDYSIEGINAGWEAHTSWNKTLYVPVVKFDVKNTGTGSAKEITVKCVFIEGDDNKVWDDEVVYVVGSSDKPLEPGYSKQAFVYSSVGYTRTPVTPPAMKAEIYINDHLIETVQISK